MTYRFIWPILAVIPTFGAAQTTLIDLEALASKTVHEVAKVTPLALTENGAPAVLELSLDAGAVVPPHATQSGMRLLTVLRGEVSWGDGSTIDETVEQIYGPGNVLTIPAGADHWLAARHGSVTLQLILLDDETLVPGIAEQIQ